MNEVEAALGSLVPSRSRIDRDRIMYRAGQASARPISAGRWPWLAAAGFALLASGEAALLTNRPPPQVVERVVVIHDPAPAAIVPKPDLAATPPPAGQFDGLGLTRHDRLAAQVFRYGLDGLPGPSSARSDESGLRPLTSRQRIEEELRRDLLPGDPS